MFASYSLRAKMLLGIWFVVVLAFVLTITLVSKYKNEFFCSERVF